VTVSVQGTSLPSWASSRDRSGAPQVGVATGVGRNGWMARFAARQKNAMMFLLSRAGLQNNENAIDSRAQTERRGFVGTVRDPPDGGNLLTLPGNGPYTALLQAHEEITGCGSSLGTGKVSK
jgi:hypothetical protein